MTLPRVKAFIRIEATFITGLQALKWLVKVVQVQTKGSNPFTSQILRVINLRLTGSKLSIDYGVKAHRTIKYKNSHKTHGNCDQV